MLHVGFQVISDLHLWGKDDPLYPLFIRWINRTQCQHLVLLGDIFDVLVGSHPLYRVIYSDFFQALEDASKRGIQIHFVEGNHDFLIKDLFHGIQNFNYHPRQFTLSFGNKRFYFAHGDLANPADWSYRLLRFVLRSLPFQCLVSITPAKLILSVGSKWSRYSRNQNPALVKNWPSEVLNRFRTRYRNFAAEYCKQGYDYVILGHCHDNDEIGFRITDRECFYMNIGFPRIHHQFIEWKVGFSKPNRISLF